MYVDSSENLNQPVPPAEDQQETIVDDKHQSQPVVEDEHSDIELDLKDTGILPSEEENENEDIAMSNENEQLAGRSETVESEKKEVDVDVQDPQQVGMDVDDNSAKKETDQHNLEAIHGKKLVVLLEKYSEVENNRTDKETHEVKESESEQDSEDASDSGIETDGWIPEGVAKKKEKQIKKQTQTMQTTDGSLPVHTVGRPKWIPRKRKHQCHLCEETFEMQCHFTKHYAMKHPDQPFKCEHCGATMQTPNGLFKHQRSHTYLKHQCEQCGKRFQFPGQKVTHMKILTGEGLYPCLHCKRSFTLNSTMMIHTKTHSTQLQCELCPKDLEKCYNSQYALGIHQQGMHHGGWNSFCGKNFKWKSKYSCHVKKCTLCTDKKECIEKLRHLF